MVNTTDPLALAREYFPHLDDDELKQIILEHTGYHCLFEGDRETVLRRQLEEYAATRETQS